MKFFKHFTDGHSSTSMTKLMNVEGFRGVEAYGAYFILIEMCVEKMHKERDQELTEEHCKFRFPERVLKEKLRMRATRLALFCHSCATCDLLSYTQVEDEWHFYVPKLLEFMDRQSRRARPQSGQSVAKACLDKDKEEDKDITLPRFDVEAVYAKYPRKGPGKKAGLKKLEKICKSQETYDKVMLALDNYIADLKRRNKLDDKEHIKHFSTFVNNYEDYLEAGFSQRTEAPKPYGAFE